MATFVWQAANWAQRLHRNADRLLPLLAGARRVHDELPGRADLMTEQRQ
jgi:hypothetical protein